MGVRNGADSDQVERWTAEGTVGGIIGARSSRRYFVRVEGEILSSGKAMKSCWTTVTVMGLNKVVHRIRR